LQRGVLPVSLGITLKMSQRIVDRLRISSNIHDKDTGFKKVIVDGLELTTLRQVKCCSRSMVPLSDGATS
jgi:hypothetical protein